MRRKLREVSSRLSGALAGPRDEAPSAPSDRAEVTPAGQGKDAAVSTIEVDAPTASVEGDLACVAAVAAARAAAIEVAGDAVGEHLGVEVDEALVVTHSFATTEKAYRGWRWAVTVARADGSDEVTVDEVVLLPGAEALVSPEWVPYADRIQPGDLSPGDLLPTKPDDLRLVPAYADPDAELFDQHWELGLGRERVLSLDGRADAAERWYDGEHGPRAPIAKSAPAKCVDCGFLVPLGGSLRAVFGACANALAPDDGRVVSLDHGCGAHSEVLAEIATTAGMAVEHDELEMVDSGPPEAVESTGHTPGTVDDADPAEPLGHS
ncbi:MAG: DUF3027 domain-containing protein [Mycobacteriales bacterium]